MDPSQEKLEDDDDTEDSYHHPSVQPHAEEETQNHVQPKEGQSSWKKQKEDKTINTTTLTKDELQEFASAVAKVVQDNLGGIRAQQESTAT